MISCEQFESLYPFSDEPEVMKHRDNCIHCSKFDHEYALLRAKFSSFAFEGAPVGFELRLQQHINQPVSDRVKVWEVTPRALAFASGMAAVLIAGGLYTGVHKSSNPQMVKNPPAVRNQFVEAEADTAAQDSLTKRSNDTWGNYTEQFKKQVSAQPQQ